MKRLLSLVVGILFVLSSGVAAQDLTVITTTWAPYNMEENGKVTGIGTEVVQATLEKAGIRAEINIYPWARAYKMASEKPNTMIYTIIKLPGRESLFKWVGPIIPVKSVLHKIKKRTDIVLNSLEDAKKYKIGTTRNSAGHQFLLKQGFEDEKHVESVNSNEMSIRKLFSERVDLNFMYEAKRLGFSYSDIEHAWVLFENEAYIAFSQSTSDEVVERFRTAFDQVKAAGTVDTIIGNYLKMYQ